MSRHNIVQEKEGSEKWLTIPSQIIWIIYNYFVFLQPYQ